MHETASPIEVFHLLIRAVAERRQSQIVDECYAEQERQTPRWVKIMIRAAEFIATLSAVLFAGAALYINVAEHPARMSLDTRTAALQWAPSYKRATWLQAPLALVSLLSGVTAWLLGAGVGWLFAALFVGAVVPFTFIGIMPTNHKLLAPGRDLGSAETRTLLERWGRLHAVRTSLSIVASVIYICLALSGRR